MEADAIDQAPVPLNHAGGTQATPGGTNVPPPEAKHQIDVYLPIVLSDYISPGHGLRRRAMPGLSTMMLRAVVYVVATLALATCTTTPPPQVATASTARTPVTAGAAATGGPPAAASRAQAPTIVPSGAALGAQDIAAQVDAYLTPRVAAETFSGSILIARGGKILVSKGYGRANRELDVPNTPQTKFRLGSVTKQFTAMAILRLQQQGKLTVQDRICAYIPQCPAAWQAITIHQLLTHTSGLWNFTDLPDYQRTKTLPSTPSQTLARVKDKPLLFTPGAGYSYSNTGYVLLGYIIEKVAKKLYPLVLREQIFAPLQMRNTGYDTSIVLPQRAAGYTAGGQFNADYIDMSIPHAAGGLYSTVEDLYRWDQALSTDKLVPQAALATMFTAHAMFPPPREGGYGYGWEIFKVHDRRVTAHLGGIEGFSAGITRFPDDKVTVIVLSNVEAVDVGTISMDIADMVFKAR